MKLCRLLLLGLTLTLAGCVTKKAANAQAQAAYFAGQRQALNSMPPPSAAGLNITIKGDVQIPVVPWTPETTLAKALVTAGYQGKGDPKGILILRNGRAIQVDPQKLLKGEDVPLQPLDIVVLQ